MTSVAGSKTLDSNGNPFGDEQNISRQVCPTRLIDDIPAADDLLAFDGDIGPHARVAKTIAEMIQSPEERGGKMIGLEGGWGAGKTTVINLLQNQLKPYGDITVFSFDAWAHEGDPLRRTFLESMIRHFQAINWIDKKRWDETIETLAKRRRIANTRIVPKTTALGKLFAMSVLLLPLGGQLVASSLRSGITLDTADRIHWMFIFGLLFSAAPFIVLGGNAIRIGLKKFLGQNFSTDDDDSQKVLEWAFIGGNAITETKQDITETPEPTSIEFEDEFRKLMRSALSDVSNKKAVIVLDNLDRIDNKDALSIWSTLQTFLQDRTEQWYNKLWIIVPYDPSGLRHLWDNRGATEGTADEEDTDKVVSDSFLDKSFQLRFEVSPPVLSNWKLYLFKLVKEALPEHSQEEQHIIYRVFNSCRAKHSEAPTPRELKLFVNQIGAIHRQWQHVFPIGHIAYYVILRRNHAHIRNKLLEGNLPDRNIELILPPNLRPSLAGLAFNVRDTLGQQLLLGDPINNSLVKNDTKELKNIETNHQDGFWAVLEDVTLSRFDGLDAKSVANIALCLEQSELLKQSRNEVVTIIRKVGQVASTIKIWSPIDENMANGVAAVCRMVSDPNISKQVLLNLYQTIKEPKNKDGSATFTDKTIPALGIICDQIIELGQKEVLSIPFIIPVDAGDWVALCPQIAVQKESLWSLLKPQVKFEQIAELLGTSVLNAQFLDVQLTALTVTQSSWPNSNWDTLATAIEQRLVSSANSEETNRLLQGLTLLQNYECTKASAVLKAQTDSGYLMHHLFQAQAEKNSDCMALCIVSFLEQQPSAAKPAIVGNSDAGFTTLQSLLKSNDVDLANKIIDILKGQHNLDLLLKIVDAKNQYDPLIIMCLRLLADGTTPETYYTSELVLNRWIDLMKLFEDKDGVDRFSQLVSNLCEKSSLVRDVQNVEGGFASDDIKLYSTICRVFSSDAFNIWCREGLERLDTSYWKTELVKDGDSIELLLILMDAGIQVKLMQPYQDALVEHAKGVLSGGIKLSERLLTQRQIILSALGSEAGRAMLRSRLRDEAMSMDGNCGNDFFEMYGDEVKNSETLTGEGRIVEKLFSPLVRQHNVKGLQWLKGALSDNEELLDKYTDKTSVQDFRERIQVELGKATEVATEAHILIAEIANILGILPKEGPLDEELLSPDDNSEKNDGEG